MGGERGLTLLEIVVALMLFAVMGTLLLSGQGRAADQILKARIERDIAYLLPLRLNLVALSPDDYENGDEGGFPSDKTSRFLEESKILGDEYSGYRWRLEKIETVGAGADAPSKVAGGDPMDLLFSEEQQTAEEGAEPAEVESDKLDRMWFLRVTVFPPGYDENAPQEVKDGGVPPRAAWTAIAIPPETEEETR